MVIEIKERNFYNTHNNFVNTIREYAKKCGFQIRLGKVERNAARNIRKRTVVCSHKGNPEKNIY